MESAALPNVNASTTLTYNANMGIKLTHEPDIFSFEEDYLRPRGLMSCGHAVLPATLKEYCLHQLQFGKTEFRCPAIKNNSYTDVCGRQWSYPEVRKMALLNDQERMIIELKLSQNALRKEETVQECPSCGTFCERKSIYTVKVTCQNCRKLGRITVFCWQCLHKWKSDSNQNCGNAECGGEDFRVKILREAPVRKIKNHDEVPSVRSCPKCGLMIEHVGLDTCQTVICPCGFKFCFISLIGNTASERKPTAFYQRTTHDSNDERAPNCELAPIQTVLTPLTTPIRDMDLNKLTGK